MYILFHKISDCVTANPNLTSLAFKKPIIPGSGAERPIDKITSYRDNSSNYWKSPIMVETVEHNVPKFEVVLIFYNFEEKKKWGDFPWQKFKMGFWGRTLVKLYRTNQASPHPTSQQTCNSTEWSCHLNVFSDNMVLTGAWYGLGVMKFILLARLYVTGNQNGNWLLEGVNRSISK